MAAPIRTAELEPFDPPRLRADFLRFEPDLGLRDPASLEGLRGRLDRRGLSEDCGMGWPFSLKFSKSLLHHGQVFEQFQAWDEIPKPRGRFMEFAC